MGLKQNIIVVMIMKHLFNLIIYKIENEISLDIVYAIFSNIDNHYKFFNTS